MVCLPKMLTLMQNNIPILYNTGKKEYGMGDKLHRKMMILAITLLDKQEGMPLEEWNILRAVLDEGKTYDGREIINNVTVVGDRVFLNEDWVEENYHKYE